jgi:hypothetical protein
MRDTFGALQARIWASGKRLTNRAFRISLTRENVCPLTGKLRSTNEDGYGSFQS